ncbi:5'-3' exoribonuclease 1 [Trichomonascus vanleenenianus]|uniref:chromatin-binding exonuclease XRN1 n=1 Tax=Trichomonascus vanleenenianus TaxID=2268995 RepID=UPI003ECB6488
MGIPKFFRYVSERWPLISQLINESQVPEFDNLYLDMNSILHTCTHKDSDSDARTRLTEEEMFVNIFNYIEHLFGLIKPKKMFYMAIDGVAPRAKMNQQRARRFRTALDAEKARKRAIEQGIELPKEDPFDSNAITPGTEFMEKMTKQLKYFINRKVSEDVHWQGIEIILSGHEVPGEGEHKIMERIRIAKAQPDYDSNMRHCLYGLDADLIMLGLLSHDPHFALLREEVTFGRTQKRSQELTEQRFFLLHLSLVREYLEMEFADIKDDLPFQFDFERVLDDWILINYFIGNDFLPELPSLLINEGALPTLMGAYKNSLKDMGGYVTREGTINFERLRIWLDELSKFELHRFEDGALDAEWFNEELEDVSVKSLDNPKLKLTPREKELLRFVKPFVLSTNSDGKPEGETDDIEVPSLSIPDKFNDSMLFLRTLASQTHMYVAENGSNFSLVLDIDGFPENEDDDDADSRMLSMYKIFKRYENAPVETEESSQHKKELYNKKFEDWKKKYYKDKFGIKSGEPEGQEVIKDVAENYLEGLQWVLYYYYTGCKSWGWYYRYHYAPCISDIRKGLTKDKIDFNLGTPFHPFEQLMGVLPDRSKTLVPPAYHTLMTDETSPIIDFYPREFELDKNGKKNDWEAVVKIPFVDEKRLLAAMETRKNLLTPEEIRRNQFSNEIQFVFNPQVDKLYPSSLPGVFLDLEHSHCIEVMLDKPSLGNLKLRFGLMENAKLGTEALAGFPSLKTLSFSYKWAQAGVKVFQQPSRNESLILTVKNAYASETANALAEKLIGESVYIGWPYLQEAKVCAISDELFRYEKVHNNVSSQPHSGKVLDQWVREARKIEETFKKLGVEIGRAQVLIHVKKLKGLQRTPDGAYVKEFAGPEEEEVDSVAPLLVEEVINEDERFKERPSVPVSEEFPVESRAIFLGPSGYGYPVTVSGHHDDKIDIKLHKLQRPEPTAGRQAMLFERQSIRYFPSYEVSRMLNIHPLFLSKITSKYLVKVGDKNYDIGLSLKFEAKRLKVLGYSRRSLKSWDFSAKAVALIKEYLQTFPDLFAALSTLQGSTIPDLGKLMSLEASEARVKAETVRRFLKEKIIENPDVQSAALESDALSTETIRKVEKAIVKHFEEPDPVKVVQVKNLPRQALLPPGQAYHQLRSQHFDLGDRVVSALSFGKVKLFHRGTVIGINSETTKVTLDVLFDEEFDAGNTLGGRATTKRGLTVDAGSVVNLSNRQCVYHSKKSAEAEKKAKAGPQAALASGPVKAAWGGAAAAASAKVVNNVAKAKKPVNKRQTPPPANKPKIHLEEGKVKILQRPKEAAAPPVVDNEQLSRDLLAMVRNGAAEKAKTEKKADEKPKRSNEEVLSSIKEVKRNTEQSQNILGAVYSQFMPPPLPPPNMMPPIPPNGMMYPPPPPPGFPIPPPPPFFSPMEQSMTVDEKATSDLMAALHIGSDKPEGKAHHGDASRGRGNFRGRGRGGMRGRGRGGRGRGNGNRGRGD